MKRLLRIACLGLCLVNLTGLKANEDTLEILELLGNQVSLIKEITPTVERVDLARLIIVEKAVNELINNIEENRKSGKRDITRKSMRLLDHLIIQYKYSHVFFGWEEDGPSIMSIFTYSTEDELKELQLSYHKLIDIFGLDDSPYSTITSSTFSQMHKLLKSLEDLAIDAELKKKLRSLWPQIGNVIAESSLGDRRLVYPAALKVIEEIRALYKDFRKVASTDVGFSMILELQGLTEFYAEFSQADCDESGECR